MRVGTRRRGERTGNGKVRGEEEGKGGREDVYGKGRRGESK